MMNSMKRVFAGAALLGVAGMGQAAVTVSATTANVVTVTMSANGDTLTVTKPAANTMRFFDGTTNSDRGTNGGTACQSVIVNDTSVGGGIVVVLDEAARAFTHTGGGGTPIQFTINASDGDDAVSCLPVTVGGLSLVPVTYAAGTGTDSFSVTSSAGGAGAKGVSVTGANAVTLTGFTNAKTATGVETVDYDDNSLGNTVTVTDGSGAAQTMTVDPSSATAASAGVNGVVVQLVDLTATPTYAGGGQVGDTLSVFGQDTVSDTIAVANTSVGITGLLGTNFGGFDNLTVNGGDEAGATGDTVTLAVGASTGLTLVMNGGLPTAVVPGDTLIHNSEAQTNSAFETVLVPVTVSGIEID